MSERHPWSEESALAGLVSETPVLRNLQRLPRELPAPDNKMATSTNLSRWMSIVGETASGSG